jgi:hypothetical protein
MALTPAQLTTLAAAIAADSNVNTIPNNGDGHYAIADYYAQASTKDVWRSEAPVSAISDAIDWSRYTPTDAASDGDSAAVAAAKTNRLLAIQTKTVLSDEQRFRFPCDEFYVKTPIEVARAIRFLCSEDAAYITGQVIHVNGGMYM